MQAFVGKREKSDHEKDLDIAVNDINTYFRELRLEGVEWIHLAQDRDE
jgi:hypothetical protein